MGEEEKKYSSGNIRISEDVIVSIISLEIQEIDGASISPASAKDITDLLSKKGVSEERSAEVVVTPKLLATLGIIALVCGFYDGFYGPGSGTFLVVGLSLLTPLGVKTVSAHAKVINLCDNLAAFVVFLVNGRMVIWLGVLVGICSMVGAWIGAGAVMKSGAKIMKPLLLVALILLVINLITKF